jgi:IclR family pca regulon transcriptional regulator
MSSARVFEDALSLNTPDAEAVSPGEARESGPLKRDLVAGLEKGLAVIEAFDQERPRLTISEVAQRTGLTRAAARRYLLTLSHLGFVTQDRKMFGLTPRVLRLGHSYSHSARLPRLVRPELFKLSSVLKEICAAGVLDGSDVICIAGTSGGRTLPSTLQAGTRTAASYSAMGRVLLAAQPAEDVDEWIACQELTALTPQSITHPERLRLEIMRARAQGFACIDQELESGVCSIAVPLKNYRGEVVAAIAAATHNSRMSMEQLQELCLQPLLQSQAHLRMLL